MISLRVKQVSAWIVWTASALLVIAILVGLLVWGIVSTQQASRQASERRDDQIAALVHTVTEHEHDAAADRRTAAANQRALLDYTATLAARQDALLAYLRAHGIHLPQRLVTVVPRPRIIVRHHHAGHHSKHHSKRRSSRTTVAPAGPGKSDHAPGHRKHRPH